MRSRPTDKTRTVRLTLSEWNSVFVALNEARRWNSEHKHFASADAVVELKKKIADQVDVAVDAAFAREFPDEFGPPAHKVEGSQAEFDRYIAGDR